MKQLVILVLLAGVALADPKTEAKQHVDKATAAHAAGKYADALAELEEAYKLDAQPGLLYAIAQVHVKLDECAKAIPLYEQFVASKPEAKAAAAATEAITACKTKMALVPEPKVEAPKVEPVPAPEHRAEPPPPPPERPAGKRGWYADPINDSLLGAGVAATVVGVVMYRSARSDIDAAHSADNYGKSEDLAASASKHRTIAAIAGAGGVALVTAGVLRIVLGRDKSEHAVAIAPAHDGAAITWSGRF